INPAGRTPLSRSSSNSYPRTPPANTPDPDTLGTSAPPPLAAIDVLRQKRIAAAAAGTVMLGNCAWQHWVVKIVPVRAFSGRPPSAGGLKRGSRPVPVQVGGSCGSITALACVSLYETRVRYGVAVPSILDSHRTFQNSSLPLKNAR